MLVHLIPDDPAAFGVLLSKDEAKSHENAAHESFAVTDLLGLVPGCRAEAEPAAASKDRDLDMADANDDELAEGPAIDPDGERSPTLAHSEQTSPAGSAHAPSESEVSPVGEEVVHKVDVQVGGAVLDECVQQDPSRSTSPIEQRTPDEQPSVSTTMQAWRVPLEAIRCELEIPRGTGPMSLLPRALQLYGLAPMHAGESVPAAVERCVAGCGIHVAQVASILANGLPSRW